LARSTGFGGGKLAKTLKVEGDKDVFGAKVVPKAAKTENRWLEYKVTQPDNDARPPKKKTVKKLHQQHQGV